MPLPEDDKRITQDQLLSSGALLRVEGRTADEMFGAKSQLFEHDGLFTFRLARASIMSDGEDVMFFNAQGDTVFGHVSFEYDWTAGVWKNLGSYHPHSSLMLRDYLETAVTFESQLEQLLADDSRQDEIVTKISPFIKGIAQSALEIPSPYGEEVRGLVGQLPSSMQPTLFHAVG